MQRTDDLGVTTNVRRWLDLLFQRHRLSPAHDPLAYLPAGVAFEDWRDYARAKPEEFTIRARESMARHVEAMVGFADAGSEVFDYGNSIRAEAKLGGYAHAFDFPGFVPAYIRPLFCEGKGPFRRAALSGNPADIAATDRAVLDLFPQNESLARWLRMAGRRCTSRACRRGSAGSGTASGTWPGPGSTSSWPPGKCRRRSSSGATTWTAGRTDSPGTGPRWRVSPERGYRRLPAVRLDRRRPGAAGLVRRPGRHRGMACEQDRNGNQWAWWGDPAPGAVVTGS